MTPMTGMRFIGVDQRVKKTRAELNRLHWEVEYAIEQGRANSVVSTDLAETVGILSNILEKLGKALQEQPADELDSLFGEPRARFAEQVRFYTEVHKVAR